MTPQQKLKEIENLRKSLWFPMQEELSLDQIDFMISRIKVLEKALEFYRDGFKGRNFHGLWDVPAERDGGQIARKALERTEEKK